MMQSGSPVPPQINLSNSILSDGTFNQHNYIRNGERPGYARLLENVATAALHDSVDNVDPPKCHPNTRVAVMQTIHDWTLGKPEELSGKPILWLKGGAGAGKSAIARSVAERCSDEGLLLGTFFFGAADSTRNHVGKLVATLSYQISVILPGFRDMVAAFIEDDPLIFGHSISTQFTTLIIRPLSIVLANRSTTSSATPCLIIIDGLDECSAVNSQQDLLLNLQEVTNTTTLVRFLVCSRPESHLNIAFSLLQMATILYKIFLDNDYSAREDIQVYLEDKFKEIKEGHLFKHMLPDPWPTFGMVFDLVRRSSEQFIYAATVVRYVDSPRHRPDQRLNAIFKLQPPFKGLPFTELDALYQHVISKAEDLSTVLDVLAFPALYRSSFAKDIEAILALEQGTAEVLLAEFHSIITISAIGDVKFLHKSFADFLSEPQRAGPDLYRDLSRARLSHAARVISIFSTQSGQQMQLTSTKWLEPIAELLSELKKPGSIKADYISSNILLASQQFTMLEFVKPLLLCGRTEQQFWEIERDFIQHYFNYLYYIKDVDESARLVYWEQMHQYCECVLAVLDNNLSDNWHSHFIFAYYHLLHDPCYCLPRKLSYANLHHDFSNMEVGTFGDTILCVIGRDSSGSYPYSNDIAKIFHDLIGDIKKEMIFAKAASFCLAFLCDEWCASQEAGHIYGIARHDRHKKRDHPWHWRQMVPRPPSLGNRLVLIGFRKFWYEDYRLKLTSIRKALRNTAPYRYENIRVITMREYFEVKSEPVLSTKYVRPQLWPRYLFLLDLLPHILPLAGRYKPLLDMCRKKCFSSLSQFWPKKSRYARQAIESYLHRAEDLYQDLESGRARLFRTSSQLLKTSPDLLTAWAVPEQAAAFIQGIREVILDSIFASHQIGPSQYALYVGFDHLSLQNGFGYMQQIHIFTSVDVSNTSRLIPELGKLFLPFSSMIFTPSMCMRLPVIKGDGTEWEFDDYAESMATRWSDRGETGSFNPTIVDLSLETRSNNTEGGVQDEEQAAPSGDDDGLSSKVPSREGDDRKDKKDQMDRSDGRRPDSGDGDGSSEGGGGGPGGGGDGGGGGGGGDGDGDNSGNEAPAGPCLVSYKVTSNLYSDKKKEVFQILKSEGDIAIQIEEELDSRTYKINFRNLKLVSACEADVAAPFEQNYMQVVIDSQEKYTNIANVKPLPTPASDREVKVVETTKTTRTLLLGVAAAIGAPTKATLNGTASHAKETGQTQEHKRYTSRITTSDASGVVWWGYNVDDANQRQEGLRMLEGHENLPSASLTYKLPLKVTLEGCPEEEKYGSSSSSTRRTSATKSIDIEVASYWSLISEEKNLSLDVFRKLIATANKNREHVPYSNLIHFVVLTIPPEPQPKSNYVSTMVFQNKYSKTPTLQNYEVGEKEGNIEVFEGVRHNEQGSAGHSGHSLRKTMLSLPSLRNVPLRPRFILQPGQGASQSSRILSDKPYGIYPEALEGDDEAKNFNVKEVESPPAQATDQFNAKGGKQFRLQFAQASMKV